MKADDDDPRTPGEGQAAQAPTEPTPGDPSQAPVPSAPSPRPLQSIGREGVLTFDWTSLRGYVFSITDCLAVANDLVQVIRQKMERMTAEEWLGISDRNEYIDRIAHDRAMDWLAEEKRQRDAAKRLKKATVLDPDVLRRIKQPRVREAFILRNEHGLSAKEIAKLMGIREDTVKEYLAKAADQLSTLDGNLESWRKRARLTGSTQSKKES